MVSQIGCLSKPVCIFDLLSMEFDDAQCLFADDCRLFTLHVRVLDASLIQ
jgi:hypothetical protein